MEHCTTFTPTLEDLILLAARQGDAVALERHLSTVNDPDVYVDRIYDEPNEQKCTLLMIACLNGHKDIISFLLRCFKPDLEVLNAILLDIKGQNRQMYQNVTVLWAAAAIENFEIVKLLIEHGAHVNHITITNSTPLRCACANGNINMARYLIEHGADIRIAKEHHDTNLMVSVYFKHLKMVAYLVDELGCDVDECDDDGRSALYDAVKSESSELVQFLLDHGARNFQATSDQMTPLMWAAELRCSDIVEIFSGYCSLLEAIEAKELLGSAFACAEEDECDLEQSVEHLSEAIKLRSIHGLKKVIPTTTAEVFGHRQECQTIGQLNELRSNPVDIHIEALLVRERLLRPSNKRYRKSLRSYGILLADEEQYDRAVAFWTYELALRQQYSISVNTFDLRSFASIFAEVVSRSLPVPIQALLQVMTVTSEELAHPTTENDYNMHTLLFLITIASQMPVEEFSVTDRRTFAQVLRTVNERQYISSIDGSSFLHLSLNENTSTQDYDINSVCQYPCLNTTRLLLQYGADVDATDAVRNTPLHVFVSNTDECNEAIIDLLLDTGAHLDSVNAFKDTPADLAPSIRVKQLLKAKMRLSLKCICARLIREANVPFRGKIASSLANFVEKH